MPKINFPHDCMDAEDRAPTVGALGDAGAVAEQIFYLVQPLAIN